MYSIGLATSLLLLSHSASAQFNNPAGVDIWCGKAYRASNASFNPGGQFIEPAVSDVPLLNLKIAPRYSIYIEDEASASVLINASLSYLVGTALDQTAFDQSSMTYTSDSLAFSLFLNGKLLDTNTSEVKLGELAEVPIDIYSIPAQLEPSNLTITACFANSSTSYTASTGISKLPIPSNQGTAARIDNLYKGLSVRKADSTEWMPIFPYTYYVQWTLYWNTSVDTLEEFSKMGYNMIHIVPTGSLQDQPFPWSTFQPYLDKAAQLGLFFQYDVLFEPTNFTRLTEQVTRLKDHPSILLWYIADEPDGKSNPLNATRLGYETIKSIDPYHPVSEALNCYDFYYEEYASGAEVILSDVYPISTNTSFSTVYNTTCNATYGCCGCDDCHGSFKDIADRLDYFTHMDDVIGWEKVQWGVPQAFGNETFWTRYPTAAEEVVMTLLYINHNSKGIVMWNYPVPNEILSITNKLSEVLTNSNISSFFIGSNTTSLWSSDINIDAAVWVGEKYVLVSIVNMAYGYTVPAGGEVNVLLPDGVDVFGVYPKEVVWGEAEWKRSGDGMLGTSGGGLKGLEVSLLIFERDLGGGSG